MTPIAEMVLEMIARGIDPEVIGLAVSAAEQAVAMSARHVTSADESVTYRRESDRLRKQRSRDRLVTNRDVTGQSQDASISKDFKKDSKRQNSGSVRGTRISPDWSASDAEKAFARQEGFSDFEIQRETQKFRDWWTACAGAKGVKLDWAATWRQWIRSGAERSGKAPILSNDLSSSPTGFYAKSDSEQLAAWDAYTGKSLPRDRNGGWFVKTEWPPNHQPTREAAE